MRLNPFKTTEKPLAVESFRLRMKEAHDKKEELHVSFNRGKTEAFLIKGNESSKPSGSRPWQALHRRTASEEDKLLALKTAAKKDIGAKGPTLVEEHMRQKKALMLNQTLTREIVSMIKTDRLPRDIDNVFKANGNNSEKLATALKALIHPQLNAFQLMQSPQGLDLLRKAAERQGDSEQINFMVEGNQTQKILDSDASAENKHAALKLVFDNYISNVAARELNLPDNLRREVKDLLENSNGSLEGEDIDKANRMLKGLIKDINQNMTNNEMNILRDANGLKAVVEDLLESKK